MYGSSQACIFTVIVGKISTKRDTQNFLGDCVVLNTYSDILYGNMILKVFRLFAGWSVIIAVMKSL